MKSPILNKLFLKHGKSVEKTARPFPVTAEDLTKQSADAIARMTRRGLVWDRMKHRWVKPTSSNAPKTRVIPRWQYDDDIDNEAEEYAREHEEWEEQHGRGRELDRVQEEWDKQPVRRKKIKKQSPDVAARMWQRGLVWDGNKHRWVKRPETTHEDAPSEGKSYQGNVIVIPKDKSFWGSGPTYGETEKASKILAAMLEHKFPGSTVVFGQKPIIEGEHKTEIDSWIERNWKKAVSRRRGRTGEFDKSSISDAPRTSHGSEKDKEQRKKDAKFWEEKNQEYLRNHPDRRGGR